MRQEGHKDDNDSNGINAHRRNTTGNEEDEGMMMGIP